MRAPKKETRVDKLYPLLFSGNMFILAMMGMCIVTLQWIYCPHFDVMAIYVAAMMICHKDASFATTGIISIAMTAIFALCGQPCLHYLFTWILLSMVLRKLPNQYDFQRGQLIVMHAIVLALYEMVAGLIYVFCFCVIHPTQFINFWSMEYSRIFDDAVRMTMTALISPLIIPICALLNAAMDEEE